VAEKKRIEELIWAGGATTMAKGREEREEVGRMGEGGRSWSGLNQMVGDDGGGAVKERKLSYR
jgi:hypothetical protein